MESREDFYFDDSDNPGSDDTIEKEDIINGRLHWKRKLKKMLSSRKRIYWNRQNLRLPNG